VIPLVQNETRVDALLLRWRSRKRRCNDRSGREHRDASRALRRQQGRGDVVHRREESRFQLQLNGDAQTALRLARENWNVQREPADLRVLAEAAAATGDPAAKETVRQWLAQTGLEYPAVAALIDAGGSGRK
jgi:hypothetical protein